MENTVKTIHKLGGLGIFWTVAAITAELLPPTGAAVAALIGLVVVLAGLGSIVVSVFFGGDGFDHLGSGFVLALAGFLLVHFSLGWDLTKPYGVANLFPDNSFYNKRYVTVEDDTEMAFAMMLNLCKVAVGMAIMATPTFPIIWKLRKSREQTRQAQTEMHMNSQRLVTELNKSRQSPSG